MYVYYYDYYLLRIPGPLEAPGRSPAVVVDAKPRTDAFAGAPCIERPTIDTIPFILFSMKLDLPELVATAPYHVIPPSRTRYDHVSWFDDAQKGASKWQAS